MEVLRLLHLLYYHNVPISRCNHRLVRRSIEHTEGTTEKIQQNAVHHQHKRNDDIGAPAQRIFCKPGQTNDERTQTARVEQRVLSFMVEADFISSFIMYQWFLFRHDNIAY